MAGGARVRHPHLNPRLRRQRQGQVQTVDPRRLHTDAHPAPRARQITPDLPMPFGGVGKRFQRLLHTLPAQRHDLSTQSKNFRFLLCVDRDFLVVDRDFSSS